MGTSKSAARDAARGYTLIELVVVLAIISMLLMATAPRFLPRLFETRLDTSARRLAAMTTYLNAYTALSSGEATLYIDVEAGQYWVTTPPPEDEKKSDDQRQGAAPEFGSTTSTEMAKPVDFGIDLGQPDMGPDDVLGIEFDLDKMIDQNDKKEQVELATPFIARTSLAEGVFFAGLLVPNGEANRDKTQFEIRYGPFGLTTAALIVLKDNRGKMLAVKLDPVLGNSSVEVPDPDLLAKLGLG